MKLAILVALVLVGCVAAAQEAKEVAREARDFRVVVCSAAKAAEGLPERERILALCEADATLQEIAREYGGCAAE